MLHKEDARIGVSRQTIKKYAADKYKLEMNPTNTARLSTALTSGAEKGTFVFPKGASACCSSFSGTITDVAPRLGPAGRVKLSPAGKAAKSDEVRCAHAFLALPLARANPRAERHPAREGRHQACQGSTHKAH